MSDSSDRGRPDLSVIVVNYKNAEMATRALVDAKRSAGALAVQEIVVDIASPAEDLRLLRERRPYAQIVELSRNPGFAASCNAGIERARGRHLLVLGSDAFAIGDAVEALVRQLDAHPRIGLLAPLQLNVDGSPQDNVFRRFPNMLTLFVDFCTPLAFLLRGRRLDPYHVPRRRLTKLRAIAHANGAVLLVRAQAAADTGPLDGGFRLYLEETEWQRRMAGAGWERAVLPSARFIHVGGASSTGFALASPYYLASVCRYYDHPRRALGVIRLAALTSRIIVLAVIGLGFDSERMHTLESGFDELLARLREDHWKPARWPKVPPPLTGPQRAAHDDFMERWHEILPQRHGSVERFNHSFPVRQSHAGFHRTIEVGAGLGEHLCHERLTPEQRAAYTVVELRASMAERIRVRHPHVSVIVGDCQDRLPLPDGHFDRYVAIHVLEHLPDLPACVREAWRLLDKRRGQLLVVIPCEGGLAYSLARRVSAQPIFERTYGMSYRPYVEHEHLNRPHEILAELDRCFTLEVRRLFPLPLVPSVSLNLCLGLALRPRPTLPGGDR